MTAIEDLICLLCLVERKVMCHHHFWMKIPAHKVFDKFLHLWQAAHPRPVQRKLLVYQQWTWFKRDRSSLADKHDTAPLACHVQAHMTSLGISRAVNGHLEAAPGGLLAQRSEHITIISRCHYISETKLLREGPALWHKLNPHHLCAQCPAQ